MADFLFSTRPVAPERLRGALARYLAPATSRAVELHGAWGSLAVAIAPHDRVVVTEGEGALSVLVGEPLLREAGRLGGSAADPARRRAAHALLRDPAPVEWHRRLDGPFAALVVDTARGTGRAITDPFAWVPLFAAPVAEPEPALLLGTHPDAVAEAAGRRRELDPLSAAELVSYFTVTFPHTLYRGVEQVAPGADRPFARSGWEGEGHVYWRPLEREGFRSLGEAAAELREALVEDVRAACEGVSPVGVLLSGGEDSRAVLGALPPGVEARAFTYAPWENRELRSARRVARAYGAAFAWGRREPIHDLRYFEEVTALVGSHNMFADAHGYALHASLGLDALPVVLGGLSSDALLKGDNVRTSAKRSLRRGERPSPRGWEPARLPGVPAALLAAAAERREAFRARLAEIRPDSAEEWTRIYPFTMRKYAANHHGNRRLFRAHEPYMGSRMVELAAAVPQRWKIDRRLFRAAVLPLLAPSWWVPHSRNRFPILPHAANRVARPLLGAARGARDLVTGRLGANQESWPLWEELVRTPLMAETLRRHPLQESGVAAALTGEPGTLAREAAGWPPLQRLMLLQLARLTSTGSGE